MTRTPLQTTNFRLGDMPDQAGKTIVITGANNGLGLRAATALAGAGQVRKPTTDWLPSTSPISVPSARPRPMPRHWHPRSTC
jgi:hypothetical protein